jgi:Zn-dependent protease with chaperone function
MDIQTGPGLSPWKPGEPDPEVARREQRHQIVMAGVRYGVPALIFLAGVVVFAAVSDREVALEIGAMFWGVAIAVFLLNFFFRMGVSGEVDRDREEEARTFFDEHGRWPDEPG